jgi:hypothetical protein
MHRERLSRSDSAPCRPNWTADPATRRTCGSLFRAVNTEDLLAQLIETLDAELEQLTLLRFRLIVLGSLVTADQAFWLPMSVRELEATSEQLRLTDLRRAAATSGITEAFLLDPEAQLPQIAAQVDGGWGEMLHDRRRLLLEQVASIRSVAEVTVSALGRRSTLLREALSFLSSDGASTYGRQGRARPQIVQGAM